MLLGALTAVPAFSEEQSILQVLPAKQFPNLLYKDMTGKDRLLSQDMGKLTIVHFWATWCEACIDEYPELDLLQKTYAARGLKVVAITMDGLGNAAKVREFYDKHKIGHLTPYFDMGTSAYKKVKTRGLPTTYFVDSTGARIAIAEGPLNWRSKDTLGFLEVHLRAAK